MVNVSSEYFRSNDKKVIEDSFKSFMSKYFGRGPSLAKAFIVENCITIYCKDFLTPLEKNVQEVKDGEMLIKISRKRIIDNHEAEFLDIINGNFGRTVSSYYLDFNVKNNSIACVFMLDKNQ